MRLLRPSSKADWSLQDEWSLLQVTIIIKHHHHNPDYLSYNSSFAANSALAVPSPREETFTGGNFSCAHKRDSSPILFPSYWIPSNRTLVQWDSFYWYSPPLGFLPIGFPFIPSNGIYMWWGSLPIINRDFQIMGFPSIEHPYIQTSGILTR